MWQNLQLRTINISSLQWIPQMIVEFYDKNRKEADEPYINEVKSSYQRGFISFSLVFLYPLIMKLYSSDWYLCRRNRKQNAMERDDIVKAISTTSFFILLFSKLAHVYLSEKAPKIWRTLHWILEWKAFSERKKKVRRLHSYSTMASGDQLYRIAFPQELLVKSYWWPLALWDKSLYSSSLRNEHARTSEKHDISAQVKGAMVTSNSLLYPYVVLCSWKTVLEIAERLVKFMWTIEKKKDASSGVMRHEGDL